MACGRANSADVTFRPPRLVLSALARGVAADDASRMTTMRLAPHHGIDRPTFVLLALPIELITALGALPVGWSLITDPTGSGIGLPSAWIANTAFGTYLVPGLYLLFINGFGMLVAAALTLLRHWFAAWWTGTLAIGLIVWILVQVAVMPETSWLQWFFLSSGLCLGLVSLFWLRHTGHPHLRTT